MTRLNDAAYDGDVEVAAELINVYGQQKNKIKVFAEPLSIAALMGNIEIVQLFLRGCLKRLVSSLQPLISRWQTEPKMHILRRRQVFSNSL